MLNLFDTHCHLVDVLHQSNTDVLTSSFIPPNIQCLSVSTQPEQWLETVELSKQSSHIYAAIGVHPWMVSSAHFENLNVLDHLLSQGLVSAIGEIGLDYYPEYHSTKSLQIDFFEAQLVLANQYDLPVSIHCRKAFSDILSYLKKTPVSGIMHGFSGSYEQATEFVKLGVKIGFGAMLLNPNAKRYHRLAKCINLSDMVIETDVPYSKWNGRPLLISELVNVAQAIADIKQIQVDKVIEQTTANAEAVLRVHNG